MMTTSLSPMDAVECFWGYDTVAQKKAYETLAGGAILDLNLDELTRLFIGCVFTQSQYKANLRDCAKQNPFCPVALAITKAIKKKFTLYYVAERDPPEEMNFRIGSVGIFKTSTVGWYSHYWAHYFSRLLLNAVEKIVDTESQKVLTDALDFACSGPTCEQQHIRILNDAPVIHFSGYTAVGDCTGDFSAILFWGPWLIFGDNSNPKSFLQVYLYDRQLLTPEILQKVRISSCRNKADDGFREFLRALRLTEHKKSYPEFILEVLNGYQPHVDGLCHWYSIESVLLAFLLINCEGKVIKPHAITQNHITKSRAIHSELIFLATVDRLKRYLSEFACQEVIDVGRDGLWRRWIAAERLSQDPARWASDGIWAQKCRHELQGYFREIPLNRNTSQFFEEVLGIQVDAVEEELESVAIKGDWQTLAKWASYGVDLQLFGPSGKSPLEHLFATPSNAALIAVLNQIKILSAREQQAAAKYLAATNICIEVCYLISRGISSAEVDEQKFSVILKMMGTAHYSAGIEYMAMLNGDYVTLRSAYRYFRLQGISMAMGKPDPSCGFVMVQYWIKWFQDTVGSEYEAILDLTTDHVDKEVTFQRIQKGALTALFFIVEGKCIGIVFYQGWLISIDPSIQIHRIGEDEKSQRILKAFIDDPQNQWREFDEHFDSEVLRLGWTLANVDATLQKRYILAVFEGIYLAQDAFMYALTKPTTAEELVEAICAQSEKHKQRQQRVSWLLMRQYAVQDDLPCQEVHFEVDPKFLTEEFSKLNI
ncbi:MAG: hypothetical protein LLF94_12625 [Chlamydiales bacterium]|nr:hypothetical protein [Chlamydiales bacterium]